MMRSIPVRRLFPIAAAVFACGAAVAQPEVSWRIRQLPGWDTRAPEGHCEIRVWVDGSAELRMRGDTIFLQTTEGSASREQGSGCTQPIPYNAVRDFRIRQTAGRARVVLAQGPDLANNFTAVFRVDDTESGGSNYAFDATWRAAAVTSAAPAPLFDPVRACRDAVRQHFQSQNGIGASIDFNGFGERMALDPGSRPDRKPGHDSERNRGSNRGGDLIEGRGVARQWNESKEIIYSCLVDTRQSQVLSATYQYSRGGAQKNDRSDDRGTPR